MQPCNLYPRSWGGDSGAWALWSAILAYVVSHASERPCLKGDGPGATVHTFTSAEGGKQISVLVSSRPAGDPVSKGKNRG